MKIYETPDIGLVAAMITKGYKIHGTIQHNNKIIFEFEKDDYFMELVDQYFAGMMDVNAKSYYYNLRDLKKAIYHATENPQR